MITFITGIFVVLALALLVAKANKKNEKSQPEKGEYSYTRKNPLSPNEQAMYWKLISALPDHVVLSQVELSRCIEAKGTGAHNTIKGKSLDFVICNKSLEIVAGIEIDDKSHKKATAIKRDATKNKALETAGIKLIRWPAVPHPSHEEIQKEFSFTPKPSQDKNAIKIKILEQQLFNMAKRLEQQPKAE
ncbi:DUF2726 domain-containing protein [Glaciimonas soli]|uniref:DUF2726 domain-containing protein n=1 Tax=Glaciimonas soli TaxID=2590999 RepID=A0A843YPN6_9BURK|nr:DUF2726 domain-containing protein [Glaciimonas soli]MQQ99261.1 DUF2726 domain-containing protein [Glaciimonas soli]